MLSWGAARRSLNRSKLLRTALEDPVLGEERRTPYQLLVMSLEGTPGWIRPELSGWHHLAYGSEKVGKGKLYGVWHERHRTYELLQLKNPSGSLFLVAPYPLANGAILRELERVATADLTYPESEALSVQFTVAINGSIRFPQGTPDDVVAAGVMDFFGAAQLIAFGSERGRHVHSAA